MKIFIAVLLFTTGLFALVPSEKLYDCNEIFRARKGELLRELERIDEQKQSLNSLKAATEELLKRKEAKVTVNEKAVDAKLAEVVAKERSIKLSVEYNEKLLKELKAIKMSKTSETIAKMKPANAAAVLSSMPTKDASDILTTLKPDIVSKILAKMDPKKASEITMTMTAIQP